MHKPIPVVSIDGGAKTSKSTVCNAVAEILSQKMRVKTADAGAFYRRVTAAVFFVMGAEDLADVAEEDVDQAIAKAIAAGTAFDDTFAWGDLERQSVSRWVTVVAKRSIVQEEAMKWWGVTADQARSADVLVVNGRNPRIHLAEQLKNGQIYIAMELFTQCEPPEAARRKLLGHGIVNYTDQQLAEETQGILDRRNLDLTRPTDAFIEPAVLVPFALGDDPREIIQKTQIADPKEAPLPIRFDTTNMSKEQMIQTARSLALAALNLD